MNRKQFKQELTDLIKPLFEGSAPVTDSKHVKEVAHSFCAKLDPKLAVEFNLEKDTSRISKMLIHGAFHSKLSFDVIAKDYINIICRSDFANALFAKHTLSKVKVNRLTYKTFIVHDGFNQHELTVTNKNRPELMYELIKTNMVRWFKLVANCLYTEKRSFNVKDKGYGSFTVNEFTVSLTNDVFSIYETRSSPYGYGNATKHHVARIIEMVLKSINCDFVNTANCSIKFSCEIPMEQLLSIPKIKPFVLPVGVKSNAPVTPDDAICTLEDELALLETSQSEKREHMKLLNDELNALKNKKVELLKNIQVLKEAQAIIKTFAH